MPTIIDLNAEAEKLTTLHGMTPQATPARRKGRMARLGSYRDGILLLGTSAGTGRGHWETHPEDELIHILDGTRTLEIVCDDGPPKSFELRAGMIAVIPQGAWHRFHSLDFAMVLSAVIPGPHVELDVPDPRPHVRASSLERPFASRPPSIIDPNAELEADDADGFRNRRWRIERAASHDWLPTGTASFSPSSSRAKIIGNHIPATS
jgi:mannose-6-phosphate isomerase-like protein (cupin superfamily)